MTQSLVLLKLFLLLSYTYAGTTKNHEMKNKKTIENQRINTILIVCLFSFVLGISILTNRSASRMFLHKISTKIESISTK